MVVVSRDPVFTTSRSIGKFLVCSNIKVTIEVCVCLTLNNSG